MAWVDTRRDVRLHPERSTAVPGGKYDAGGSTVLHTSVTPGSIGAVQAEIRRHADLHCPSFVQPVTEVAIGIAGVGHYRRRADGAEQRFSTRAGFACICPDGVGVKYLHIDSGPLDLLHVYLPHDLFGLLPRGAASASEAGFLYGGGIEDPVIQGIGTAITEALTADAAVPGHLILDSFGVALAARLLQRYAQSSGAVTGTWQSRGLDDARLDRVVDYIHAHADRDLALNQLAGIACLSVFHFCRTFKIATGRTPFQYIADVRIARAKAWLSDGRRSIDEIAFATGFSSGVTLARAFRKAVGVSPSQYRSIG